MISSEELTAALPHVLSAPKDNAPVASLCFRPGIGLREYPQQLEMTRAEGIPGDRWLERPWLKLPDGSPDPRIQVSVLPQRVLDLVWQDRTLPHPGDPIIADMDMSEANLPTGSLLRVGTAVIRVSDVFNDGCVKWKVRYGKAAKDWLVADGHPALRLRGILCEVVCDGIVRLGDTIAKA